MKLSRIIAIMLIMAMFTCVLFANGKKDEAAEGGVYEFTHYFNYDWWGLKPWGADTTSAMWGERFGVKVNFEKPDADPAAKLNIMISSGDLPDSIMMDRGPDNVNMAKLGLFVDLEENFFDRNDNFQENVLPVTREQLKIDGKLYNIPNWPRKGPTGGNDAWMYNQFIWEDAGSPDLNTFEGMHDYAVAAKKVGKTRDGLDIVPFMVRDTTDANRIAVSFFRSYGGLLAEGWYTVKNGKFTFAFRDKIFQEAMLEANRWFRDGLISPTQFTDTRDQLDEKMISGRAALSYYDHSANESNRFRSLLMAAQPGNSYEIVLPFPYPPAKGYTTDDIYTDVKPTIGWNVTSITTSAKQPEKIYDLWTYLLTLPAAFEQMYGPEGILWEGLDADGLPKLKKPESEFTEDEVNANGIWFWAIPGQSDNVDNTKFAINAKLPLEKQNWVITQQANVFTPIMWTSDEFNNISISVDKQSDTGIARTLCEDYFKAELPKAIMADSAAESKAILMEILDFCDANGYSAVEKAYADAYATNVRLYGTKVTR
jgi:putative aldouronate transport system substrate-binding protein